jgi:hypothetical protein
MHLPDFLVIGTQRAGTTWLYNQLRAHPGICLGKHRKEIRYFDFYYERGVDWYKGHFQHCAPNKVIGEVTPTYLHNELVAERIFGLIPKAKLIIILRNPIDKAYSHYKKLVMDRTYRKSFTEYIKENMRAAEVGLYYRQIEKYLQYFPEEQISIFIFEEMIENPEKHLQEIYDLLGVDPNFLPQDYQKRANPSRKPLLPGLYKLSISISRILHKYNLSSMVKLVKKLRVDRIFFPLRKNGSRFAGIDSETTDMLQDYFKNDLEKLSDFLHRDMRKFWSI